MAVTPDTALARFPGVGKVREEKLEKLGLRTAGDLLRWFPRDYEDRRQVWTISRAPLGQRVCVRAMVAQRPQLSRIRKGMELVKVSVVDGSSAMAITFFNQNYVERALQAGEEYIFFGVVEEQGRRRTMVNPVFEPADRQAVTGRIMPVYRLTAGVSNHLMASLTQHALECAAALPETLPPRVRDEYQLAQTEFSYRAIHFPQSFEELELARWRLIFEELFYLSVGLAVLKGRREHVGPGQMIGDGKTEEFLSRLPFTPTGAQGRVMGEIAADLASGRPMNRLVQGDVGSGKTAVAAYAAFLTAKAGHQAALMAPTEVLVAPLSMGFPRQEHWSGLPFPSPMHESEINYMRDVI